MEDFWILISPSVRFGLMFVVVFGALMFAGFEIWYRFEERAIRKKKESQRGR